MLALLLLAKSSKQIPPEILNRPILRLIKHHYSSRNKPKQQGSPKINPGFLSHASSLHHLLQSAPFLVFSQVFLIYPFSPSKNDDPCPTPTPSYIVNRQGSYTREMRNQNAEKNKLYFLVFSLHFFSPLRLINVAFFRFHKSK